MESGVEFVDGHELQGRKIEVWHPFSSHKNTKMKSCDGESPHFHVTNARKVNRKSSPAACGRSLVPKAPTLFGFHPLSLNRALRNLPSVYTYREADKGMRVHVCVYRCR